MENMEPTVYGHLQLKEIWLLIFEMLDPISLTRCIGLNTQIRQLGNVNLVWRKTLKMYPNYQHIHVRATIRGEKPQNEDGYRPFTLCKLAKLFIFDYKEVILLKWRNNDSQNFQKMLKNDKSNIACYNRCLSIYDPTLNRIGLYHNLGFSLHKIDNFPFEQVIPIECHNLEYQLLMNEKYLFFNYGKGVLIFKYDNKISHLLSVRTDNQGDLHITKLFVIPITDMIQQCDIRLITPHTIWLDYDNKDITYVIDLESDQRVRINKRFKEVILGTDRVVTSRFNGSVSVYDVVGNKLQRLSYKTPESMYSKKHVLVLTFDQPRFHFNILKLYQGDYELENTVSLQNEGFTYVTISEDARMLYVLNIKYIDRITHFTLRCFDCKLGGYVWRHERIRETRILGVFILPVMELLCDEQYLFVRPAINGPHVYSLFDAKTGRRITRRVFSKSRPYPIYHLNDDQLVSKTYAEYLFLYNYFEI